MNRLQAIIQLSLIQYLLALGINTLKERLKYQRRIEAGYCNSITHNKKRPDQSYLMGQVISLPNQASLN